MTRTDSAPLARLLRGDAAPAGRGTSLLAGGSCTAWDGVTYANTVQVGETGYTNLPVLNPAAMSTGLVLVAFSPTGPIILGRLYSAT